MQKEYCKSLPVENRRTRFWEKMFPQRGSDGHSTALHLHGRRTRPHQNYCSGIVAATFAFHSGLIIRGIRSGSGK